MEVANLAGPAVIVVSLMLSGVSDRPSVQLISTEYGGIKCRVFVRDSRNHVVATGIPVGETNMYYKT